MVVAEATAKVIVDAIGSIGEACEWGRRILRDVQNRGGNRDCGEVRGIGVRR